MTGYQALKQTELSLFSVQRHKANNNKLQELLIIELFVQLLFIIYYFQFDFTILA